MEKWLEYAGFGTWHSDRGEVSSRANAEIDRWYLTVAAVCPSVEDAVDDAVTVAIMAQAVIDHHYAASDCGEWRRLIEAIRAAAAALEEIDDLPE